jgi:hypothetical protein
MSCRLVSNSVGNHIGHEFGAVRPSDGEVRWIAATDFPLLDASGRVERDAAGGAQEVSTDCRGFGRDMIE